MRLFTLTTTILVLGSSFLASTEARLSRRAPVVDSGTIPGTNIKVYNLMDPKTGKAMSFDTFAGGLIADIPTPGDAASNVPTNAPMKKRGDFDGTMYIRKYCVPQSSALAEFNPYHELLIGKPNSNYITGAGKPMLFPNAGIDCNVASPSPCTLTISKDITYTNAMAYTASDSASNSVTRTLGESQGQSNSSSIADTVAHTFETSWSHTHTEGTEQSLAHTTGTIETEGRSNNTMNVTIHNESQDSGTDKTTTKEKSASTADESHGQVGIDILGLFNFGGGGGTTTNKGTSNSTGTVEHNTHNTQDGSQNTTTLEDNYSKQTQDLTTETNGSSESDAETNGWSDSNTNSQMNTTVKEISISSEWSNATNFGNEASTGNISTTTNVTSSGFTWSFPVAPGDCMKAACFPNSEMVVLPYICVDSVDQTAQRIAVSAARLETENQNEISCFSIGLISCDDASQDNMPFVTYDSIIRSIGSKNVLRAGGAIDTSNPLISNNGLYTATIETNGNFVVWKAGSPATKVWESGATPFVATTGLNTYKHRVRITMRGHLIVESMNMWSKVKPAYQVGIWRESWSTQPIAYPYTVGTPRRSDNTADEYVLVLDNNGRLSFYDAFFIKLWCSFDSVGRSCPNSKGFKYQENYLVPTDFPTPDPGLGELKDPHNSIMYGTVLRSDSYIISRNVNCSEGIISGTGIQSPNGRFKVIVYPSGNLVIKDGTRNMWTSNTANMPNATAPYTLFLTQWGDLVLKDSTTRWIWSAPNPGDKASGPYKATITDQGRFVVTNAVGVEGWESWPMNNMSTAYISTEVVRVCDDVCDMCGTSVNTTTSITNTIALPTVTVPITSTTITTYAPTTTPAPNPVSILEKCRSWMTTYNIDPFVSWGTLTNTDLQAQWVYYDCACFGTYIKYGVEILRTNLGKWGTLTSTDIRNQYTTSYCNCPLAQDVYKITPNPKNWGTLTDTTLRARWTTETCDDNVNREPFVSNAQNGVPPVMTTVTDYTTNTSDQMFTTFVNTTDTITNVGVSPTSGITTTMYATSYVTNVTVAVTDTKTFAITTGVTITAVSPTIPPVTTTTTAPTTTTTTTTTTATTTSTKSCLSGYYGKKLKNAPDGYCCSTATDCIGTTCTSVNGSYMCGGASTMSSTTTAPTTTTTTVTTTTTTTTSPTSTPTCTGGKPGAGTGVGTKGQCCVTDNDCKDNCKGGKCGVCGTDFTC